MTQAAVLLDRVRSRGFSVRAVNGRLMVAPISRLPDDLRAELRAIKHELIELLAANDDADRVEWFEERSAILEHDAGMTRADAERVAAELLSRLSSHVGDSHDE